MRRLYALVFLLLVISGFTAGYLPQPKAAAAQREGPSLLPPHRRLVLPDPGPPSLENSTVLADQPGPEDLYMDPQLGMDSPYLDMPRRNFTVIYNYSSWEEAFEDIASWEYQPYYGFMKGPAATADDRAGNDADLATALVYALRKLGVPARFVNATVALDPGEATGLLMVDTPEKAESVLRQAGVRAEWNGTHLLVERILVAAWIDGGWRILDPSHKAYNVKEYWGYEDAPFLEAVGGEEKLKQMLLESYDNSTGYVNTTLFLERFKELNSTAINWLRTATLHDLLGAWNYTLLWTATPENPHPPIVAFHQDYWTPPSSAIYKLAVSYGGAGLEATLPSMAYRTIQIINVPATPTMWVLAGMVGFTGFNASLFLTFPILMVDYYPVSRGNMTDAAATLNLTISFWYPRLGWDDRTRQLHPAGYVVVQPFYYEPHFFEGDVSFARLTRLNILQSMFSLDALQLNRLERAQLTAATYRALIEEAYMFYSVLAHVRYSRMPSVVIVADLYSLNETSDTLYYLGESISSPLESYQRYSISQERNLTGLFDQVTGLHSQAVAPVALTQLGYDTVSSLNEFNKLIREKGGYISLKPDDLPAVESGQIQLDVPDSLMDDILRALESGMEVNVPKGSIKENGVDIAAAIARDPSTGAILVLSSLEGASALSGSPITQPPDPCNPRATPSVKDGQPMLGSLSGASSPLSQYLSGAYGALNTLMGPYSSFIGNPASLHQLLEGYKVGPTSWAKSSLLNALNRRESLLQRMESRALQAKNYAMRMLAKFNELYNEGEISESFYRQGLRIWGSTISGAEQELVSIGEERRAIQAVRNAIIKNDWGKIEEIVRNNPQLIGSAEETENLIRFYRFSTRINKIADGAGKVAGAWSVFSGLVDMGRYWKQGGWTTPIAPSKPEFYKFWGAWGEALLGATAFVSTLGVGWQAATFVTGVTKGFLEKSMEKWASGFEERSNYLQDRVEHIRIVVRNRVKLYQALIRMALAEGDVSKAQQLVAQLENDPVLRSARKALRGYYDMAKKFEGRLIPSIFRYKTGITEDDLYYVDDMIRNTKILENNWESMLWSNPKRFYQSAFTDPCKKGDVDEASQSPGEAAGSSSGSVPPPGAAGETVIATPDDTSDIPVLSPASPPDRFSEMARFRLTDLYGTRLAKAVSIAARAAADYLSVVEASRHQGVWYEGYEDDVFEALKPYMGNMTLALGVLGLPWPVLPLPGGRAAMALEPWSSFGGATKRTLEGVYYDLARSPIAVLKAGFWRETAIFLERNGYPYDLVEPNDPSIGSDQFNSQYRVLIVPEGALQVYMPARMEATIPTNSSALDAARIFHAMASRSEADRIRVEKLLESLERLASFASSGGTLLVLSQPFGSLYGLVPGLLWEETGGGARPLTPLQYYRKLLSGDASSVRGARAFGWTQDQSCWLTHLSKQSSSPLGLGFVGKGRVNVDGYLFETPPYATPIMVRDKDGGVAMLLVPYGSGRVIVATTLGFWGFSHRLASREDSAVARTLLEEALFPQAPAVSVLLNGTNRQFTVKVSLEAKNPTGLDANKLVVHLHSPAHELVPSYTMVNESFPRRGAWEFSVGVPARSQKKIVLDLAFRDDPAVVAGLWELSYSLYNGSTRLTTDYTAYKIRLFDRGVYAGRVASNGLYVQLGLDKQVYEPGEKAKLTVRLVDASGRRRNLTVVAYMGHPYNNLMALGDTLVWSTVALEPGSTRELVLEVPVTTITVRYSTRQAPFEVRVLDSDAPGSVTIRLTNNSRVAFKGSELARQSIQATTVNWNWWVDVKHGVVSVDYPNRTVLLNITIHNHMTLLDLKTNYTVKTNLTLHVKEYKPVTWWRSELVSERDYGPYNITMRLGRNTRGEVLGYALVPIHVEPGINYYFTVRLETRLASYTWLAGGLSLPHPVEIASTWLHGPRRPNGWYTRPKAGGNLTVELRLNLYREFLSDNDTVVVRAEAPALNVAAEKRLLVSELVSETRMGGARIARYIPVEIKLPIPVDAAPGAYEVNVTAEVPRLGVSTSVSRSFYLGGPRLRVASAEAGGGNLTVELRNDGYTTARGEVVVEARPVVDARFLDDLAALGGGLLSSSLKANLSIPPDGSSVLRLALPAAVPEYEVSVVFRHAGGSAESLYRGTLQGQQPSSQLLYANATLGAPTELLVEAGTLPRSTVRAEVELAELEAARPPAPQPQPTVALEPVSNTTIREDVEAWVADTESFTVELVKDCEGCPSLSEVRVGPLSTSDPGPLWAEFYVTPVLEAVANGTASRLQATLEVDRVVNRTLANHTVAGVAGYVLGEGGEELGSFELLLWETSVNGSRMLVLDLSAGLSGGLGYESLRLVPAVDVMPAYSEPLNYTVYAELLGTPGRHATEFEAANASGVRVVHEFEDGSLLSATLLARNGSGIGPAPLVRVLNGSRLDDLLYAGGVLSELQPNGSVELGYYAGVVPVYEAPAGSTARSMLAVGYNTTARTTRTGPGLYRLPNGYLVDVGEYTTTVYLDDRVGGWVYPVVDLGPLEVRYELDGAWHETGVSSLLGEPSVDGNVITVQRLAESEDVSVIIEEKIWPRERQVNFGGEVVVFEEVGVNYTVDISGPPGLGRVELAVLGYAFKPNNTAGTGFYHNLLGNASDREAQVEAGDVPGLLSWTGDPDSLGYGFAFKPEDAVRAPSMVYALWISEEGGDRPWRIVVANWTRFKMEMGGDPFEYQADPSVGLMQDGADLIMLYNATAEGGHAVIKPYFSVDPAQRWRRTGYGSLSYTVRLPSPASLEPGVYALLVNASAGSRLKHLVGRVLSGDDAVVYAGPVENGSTVWSLYRLPLLVAAKNSSASGLVSVYVNGERAQLDFTVEEGGYERLDPLLELEPGENNVTVEYGGMRAVFTLNAVEPSLDFNVSAPAAVPGRNATILVLLRSGSAKPMLVNVSLHDGSSQNAEVVLAPDSNATVAFNVPLEMGENEFLVRVEPVGVAGLEPVERLVRVAGGVDARVSLALVSPPQLGLAEVNVTVENRGTAAAYNLTLLLDGSPTASDALELGESGVWTGAYRLNVSEGNHTVEAVLYSIDYDATVASSELDLSVGAPLVTVLAGPSGEAVVDAGSTLNLTFLVENRGSDTGSVDVLVDAPGLASGSRPLEAPPGRHNLTVRIPVPEDVDTRLVPLSYEAGGLTGSVTVLIRGANVSVVAQLDKRAYARYENATLTVTVENRGGSDLHNLTVTAEYGYQRLRGEIPLLPAGGRASVELEFNVTGEADKVAYSVLFPSGRRIYLNASYVYLRPEEPVCPEVWTSTQRIRPNTPFTVYVRAPVDGNATVRFLKYNASLQLQANTTSSVQMSIPDAVTGAYPLVVEFASENGSCTYYVMLDVEGVQAYVEEARLLGYPAPGSTLTLEARVRSNFETNATLILRLLDWRGRIVAYNMTDFRLANGSVPVNASLRVPEGLEEGVYTTSYTLIASVPAHSPVAVYSSSMLVPVAAARHYLSVRSPYGSVSGSGWYTAGGTASFSVSPSVVYEPGGRTRHVLLGYRVDDGPIVASASGSLQMDENHTVVFLWRTEHLVEASSPHGNVTGSGWYPAGSQANVTVTPTTIDLGNGTRLVFGGWRGDVNSTSPSLAVTVDKPLSIEAVWARQYALEIVGRVVEWHDEGEEVTVQADYSRSLGNKTRLSLVAYRVDGEETRVERRPAGILKITLVMDRPHKLELLYAKQYLVEAKPPVEILTGSPTGDSWYDRGQRIALRAPLRREANNTARLVLRELLANGSTESWGRSGGWALANITVDRPLSLEAVYRWEYLVAVRSPYGSVSGSGWYTAGETASIGVSETLLDLGNRTRLVFGGWSGDIVSDSPAITVKVNRPLRIEAVWVREYLVAAESPHGSVSGGGWHKAGSTVVLEVSPTTIDLGNGTRLVFGGWSGDIVSDSPRVEVAVDRPLEARAEWTRLYEVRISAVLPGGVSVGAPLLLRLGNGTVLRVAAPAGFWLPEGTRLEVVSAKYQGVEALSSPVPAVVEKPLDLAARVSAYRLTVRIVDALGYPLGAAALSLLHPNGSRLSARTGSNGSASFYPLPPGVYEVSAAYWGQNKTLQVTLEEDTSKTIVFEVSPATVTVAASVVAVIVVVVVLLATGVLARLLARA